MTELEKAWGKTLTAGVTQRSQNPYMPTVVMELAGVIDDSLFNIQARLIEFNNRCGALKHTLQQAYATEKAHNRL